MYKHKQTGQIVIAEKATSDMTVQVLGGTLRVKKDTWTVKPTDGSYFLNSHGISDKVFREQYEEITETKVVPKEEPKVEEEINPFEV